MIIRPWLLLLPDITILLLIFAQVIPVSRLGRGVTVIQAVAPLVSFSVDDSSPPPRPPSLYQPPATSATCTDMSIRCANHHHCQVSTHHTTITIVWSACMAISSLIQLWHILHKALWTPLCSCDTTSTIVLTCRLYLSTTWSKLFPPVMITLLWSVIAQALLKM